MPIDAELAARLTLLHLRTAVPGELPLREGVCVVGRGSAAVAMGEAARRLSSINSTRRAILIGTAPSFYSPSAQ
ncbi:MAG TPA: hypothetical protein VL308_17620 [Gemmatimonadaceae bacterium]|nr:hypothetical protein [Gemmatimonadaceae bacterium]